LVRSSRAFRIEVEAAHGIEILAHAGEQIDHRRPPLRIRTRRHVSTRFVQQDVAVPLDDLDAAAIDANVVPRGIRLRAELADSRPVHGHPAVEHQLLARASRGDAGLRQDLL
jgi:hypothetical protein